MPFFAPAAIPVALHWLNITFGFVGLAVTLCLLIPRHADLERHGKDFRIIGALVRNNWLRAASLSLQAIVAAIMLTYIFASA